MDEYAVREGDGLFHGVGVGESEGVVHFNVFDNTPGAGLPIQCAAQGEGERQVDAKWEENREMWCVFLVGFGKSKTKIRDKQVFWFSFCCDDWFFFRCMSAEGGALPHFSL